MFTLPAAFGAIQLGETFSCCLAVNNEITTDVEAVSMKVEMQTATNKVPLAEVGGPEHQLFARVTIETVVSHEIRELGQHVLACTVTYRDPNGRQRSVNVADQAGDSSFLSFRKFYKFTVRSQPTYCNLCPLIACIGYEPAICEDKGPCSSQSNGFHVKLGKGQTFP